jgi:hypothetical protein
LGAHDVPFFESEFEEHNKGIEIYQESQKLVRGIACLSACGEQVHRALTCLVARPKMHAKGRDFPR